MNDTIRRLRNPKEGPYFAIAAAMSAFFILSLILSIVGIFYILVFGLAILFANGILVGTIRGNAVRVDSTQFPELYAIIAELCQKLEMKRVPEIYLLQEGGILNAFALRFIGRDFIVIYSSVYEMAYQEGRDAVAFIAAHEVAHVALGHTKKQFWVGPAMFIPFVGTAYKRACEYSADAVGAYLAPNGATHGLSVLAAGVRLSRHVHPEAFIEQAENSKGFWEWLAEHLATHPNLPKRVRAVIKAR